MFSLLILKNCAFYIVTQRCVHVFHFPCFLLQKKGQTRPHHKKAIQKMGGINYDLLAFCKMDIF